MLDLQTTLKLNSQQPLLLYERLRRRVARGFFVDLDKIWHHHRKIIYTVATHALLIQDAEFIEGLLHHLPCLARHLLTAAMDRNLFALVEIIVEHGYVSRNQTALIAQYHAPELVQAFLDPTEVPHFIVALRAHQQKKLF